ncbi:ATP-dependent Clp protease adaptor ClpS [Clostridium sp. CX1]|uniref:ATP-dependent Clp protease adapter protein ClpS n=1 Tax=Clostridium tanneri TaxID=3037988 RepID=A0ABU4JTE9_9CLOT|nr:MULTISPECIES: ATP-dependent Clp protease adaptor ClpS [unclassified Clostridium]MCT8975336.1 ATP-dependent Clp protease adaptor ClpS [Clostridium sp. CX1]MDW8801433.1 ATP-dependent Clp protease adaptor ClpS [Clostridium sp. A1-XYC3]
MSQKTILKESTDTKAKKPKMFKVLIHNDDYTTMDFVVEVLVKVFKKAVVDATKIMYDVHKKGIGVAGIYSYDIAATKMIQASAMAESSGFPLKFSMEEE